MRWRISGKMGLCKRISRKDFCWKDGPFCTKVMPM